MATSFGAYGKMPALGDFFRIDLPAGFIEPWDHWLQTGIVEVRGHLGDRWNDCYMSAPIWRFTLASGVLGDGGALGILMASVDRVGRQFPLTLVATPLHQIEPVRDHFSDLTIFESLEAAALDALEDDATRDGLGNRLSDMAFFYSSATDAPGTPGARAFECSGNPAAVLAAEQMLHGFSQPSVWTAVVDGRTRALICEGLPDAAQMTGLFDLNAPLWRHKGVEAVA